jgi:hypothetical protein
MIALHSDTAGRARVMTNHGVRVGRPRLPVEACIAIRRQLERGPFLAAFEAFGEASIIEARPRAYRVNGVMVRGHY